MNLRYKQPNAETSTPFDIAVRPGRATSASANLGFSSAVAGFGMLMRESEHRGSVTFPMLTRLAREHRGVDPHGHRAEFVRLVEVAQSLAVAWTSHQ